MPVVEMMLGEHRVLVDVVPGGESTYEETGSSLPVLNFGPQLREIVEQISDSLRDCAKQLADPKFEIEFQCGVEGSAQLVLFQPKADARVSVKVSFSAVKAGESS